MNLPVKYIFTFFILLIFNAAGAQKQFSAGIAFTADVIPDEYADSYFIPGAGIVCDYKATRHSGLNTGVYFRNYINVFYFRVAGTPYRAQVSERHVSIPLLYKFYSGIVNLSAGPDFDFYTGWKQQFTTNGATVDEYAVNKKFFLGIVAKISKQIKLGEKILLEPELHFIPVVNTDYRSYTGLAIQARWNFSGK